MSLRVDCESLWLKSRCDTSVTAIFIKFVSYQFDQEMFPQQVKCNQNQNTFIRPTEGTFTFVTAEKNQRELNVT